MPAAAQVETRENGQEHPLLYGLPDQLSTEAIRHFLQAHSQPVTLVVQLSTGELGRLRVVQVPSAAARAARAVSRPVQLSEGLGYAYASRSAGDETRENGQEHPACFASLFKT